MKLFYKAYFYIIILLIVILGGFTYLSHLREVALFNSDMEHDALYLGTTLSGLVADVWKKSGMDRALSLIHDANASENPFSIRLIWLDNSAPVAYLPGVPLEKLETVIHGGSLSFVNKTTEKELFRYTYVPVKIDAPYPGALELTESMSVAERYTRTSLLHLMITTLCLLLLVGGLLWYQFKKWIDKPLSLFIHKSIRIGEGDLSPDLPVNGRDEFSKLAGTLNAMCEKLDGTLNAIHAEHEQRLAAMNQLRHTERLATLGRLSAGMAPELGTPLNVVSGRAKLIRSGNLGTDQVDESARIIHEQADRMTLIMRSFLDFARRKPPNRTMEDMASIVRRVIEMLSPTAAKANITLEVAMDQPLPKIAVDPAQLQQVLTNLILNGIQAMPNGGRIEVKLTIEKRSDGTPEKTKRPYMVIGIQDGGEGIEKKNLAHLFEPFFTTKAGGKGTGLGLSIVHGIIEEHKGWIEVDSELGVGTCFKVFLPL